MSQTKTAPASIWIRAMPAVFVLIWSTGFIVAKFGLPYAPALTFLAIRYALSLLCFGLWIALARAAWPTDRMQFAHLAVVGVFLNAGYLGGVWLAVKNGMGAGLIALMVGLQPVLTALWLSMAIADRSKISERAVSPRQWLGLALGLAGLLLVVWRKLGVGTEVSVLTVGLALAALLSITFGTLYQKRFVTGVDVRSASFVQLAAALAVTLPLSFFEYEPIQWTLPFVGAMAWSVLVLTLGGSTLLLLLLQRGAATAVTSLLYLVPPTTAVMAWMLFGEPITAFTLAGIALTAIGVSLVVRTARPAGAV